jgi:hypothetical protein
MPPRSRKQQKFMAAKHPRIFARWRREGKAKVTPLRRRGRKKK